MRLIGIEFLTLWSLATVAATAAAAPNSLTLVYPALRYEPSAADQQKIVQMAADAKQDAKLQVTISDASGDLKSGSYPFVVARNRGLKVFKALVQEGVDPARIQIVHNSPASPGTQTITVEARMTSAARSTKALSPTAAAANAAENFTIHFASASADPLQLSEARFREFLGLVGQPDRDAVVIEGYTDSQGNAEYNLALGEQRALVVFERLVRAGLPPIRIATQSFGLAKATRTSGTTAERGADRRVVVRWTKNAVIAEAVKNANDPVPPPKKEEPAPPAEEKQRVPSTLDLVPFAGSVLPGGELKDDAKPGAVYGFGIGKEFWTGASGAARVTLSYGVTKLDAKDDSLSGPLDIKMTTLRGDYIFGRGAVRPFIGAGVGSFNWKGTIKQKSTSLQNIGNSNDTGGLGAIGFDVPLGLSATLSPEFTWMKVGGDFSQPLIGAWLALRWRI